MRNILEYPVTKEEMLEFIQQSIDELHAENEKIMRCGDMRPTLLHEIKKIVEASDYANLPTSLYNQMKIHLSKSSSSQ